MNYYYVPLASPCDTVNFIGEVEYNTQANQMICAGSGFYIDNNMPDYYPDLVIASEEAIYSAVINGLPVPVVPLTIGYHPAHRPPPRTK